MEEMIESIDDAKCWTEDYPHDNGMYTNRCFKCWNLFVGHKRRRICKVCDVPVEPEVKTELTQDEKSVLLQKIMHIADEIEEIRKQIKGNLCTE